MGSYTLVVAPIGVKFGMEEGPLMQGEKPQNRHLSKLNTGRFALRAMLPVTSRYTESVCTVGSYVDKNIIDFGQIHMHDSVGLQLGTSLQFAKIQLASLLQNCYFCLIQKTISNSL